VLCVVQNETEFHFITSFRVDRYGNKNCSLFAGGNVPHCHAAPFDWVSHTTGGKGCKQKKVLM
jgi:hypothetical protein